MSIVQFLRILAARWKMIFGVMLACVAVASVVAVSLPKRYPASARVLLDVVKPDPVTGQSVGRDVRGYVNTQVQLIRDMRVAGAVVDKLGWANDPATIASYEASGRTEADGGIRAWLGQQIIDGTSAGLVSGSTILEIQYQSSDPERSKQVVSAIRDAFVTTALDFRTDSADRSSLWFQQQAEKNRLALAEAEAALAKYMQENSIIMAGGMDGESAKLAQLQAALQQARGQQSTTDVMVAGRLANDPVTDQLQLQLATIEDELALAGARLGSEHPSYKAIEARRNTLRNQISRAQSSSRSGVSALSGAVQQSVAKLERDVEAQSKLVLERKPIIDELVRLSREVDLRRQQYESSAARTAQLRLEADVTETGLVVLGDPVASKTPSYPKVNLIIIMSALFGLGLGLLAAVISEFIARRVRGEEDLSYATGVPVLVTVGTSSSSPLRLRLQKLFGRRSSDDGDGELQAI